MSLLEIDGLAVAYRTPRGDIDAVREVTLAVAEGETVAIVGESGSGKSTTVHAIIRLLPAAARIRSGAVRFDGRDLVDATDRELRAVRGRRIGFVPQDPTVGLNPVVRIGDQVAEVLRVHGLADRRTAAARAVEALERAGLPDAAVRARQYPHELSGGMRQRVLIAIAIIGDPALIIADEPTSALDVTVQRQILDHLDALKRERGASLLLITHDLGVAADRADRIVVMTDGRIVEQGTPVEVLGAPRHPYTRRLIAAAPSLNLGAPVSDVEGADAAPSRSQGALRAPVSMDATTSRSPEAARPPAPVDAAPSRWRDAPRTRRPVDVAPSRSQEPSREPRPVDAATARHAPATVREPGPAASGAPVLEVNDLVKEFALPGGRAVQRAVDGVSFRLDRGRTLALVGESGSGKTTTARLALRLTDATSGRVRLDGVDVTDLSGTPLRELRRRVQLVQQNPYAALNPRWSVETLVTDPLRAFGVGSRAARRARAAELLDLVALPTSALRRRPADLSGGQRQRVAIARALAIEPELLVLDEPVSALDVSIQHQILTLLADIQREKGLSYLFISHDLAVVRQIAHTVGVMRRGRLVEVGEVDRVFTAAAHPYTRALLDAIPGRTLTSLTPTARGAA